MTAVRDFPEMYARTRRFTLGVPMQPTPDDRPHGDVLFTRTPPLEPVASLYAFDPEAGEERLLVEPEALLGGGAEAVTPEERARRERLRRRTSGIGAFTPCGRGGGRRVVFGLSGRVFVLDRESEGVREVPSGGSAVNPCPNEDGTRIAWVEDGDVHVDGVCLTRRESGDVTYGLAEFVAQEEMDRLDGMWWAPDGRRLAVARSDTEAVEAWYLPDFGDPSRPPLRWPYPRPGHANADVRLVVLDVTAPGGDRVEVVWDRGRFPYLARVSWDHHAPLTLLVQDRRQREEQVLVADSATGATSVLLEERDDVWLNLPDGPLSWLKDGSALVWTAESGGMPILELVDRGDGSRRRLTEPGLGLRRVLGVLPDSVVVAASAEPTETHVAEVALGSGGVRWLTHVAGVHTWAGNEHAEVLVSRTPARGPIVRARHRPGGEWSDVSSVAADPGLVPAPRFHAVGERQWRTSVVLPSRHSGRLPVLLDVYGGPRFLNVVRSRDEHLVARWFAESCGCAVVKVDGRGTPARGREWEQAIGGDFASVPLADQVDALQALAAELPVLDLGRVVVRGWSYGGYMAALAVLRRPDVFRAAVAGAPVTDWLDYDTHYTERYLGVPALDGGPSDRPYVRSSLVGAAAQGLTRPLVLVHGTADDNVFFRHTVKLGDALLRAGTPAAVVPLASLTHMADDVTMNVRLIEFARDFLREHFR